MQVVFSPGAEIKFEGANNFRELGGYRAADGRQVKYGLLYRGGNLDLLKSEADHARLASLGLREILDLRSAGESAAHPDPAVPGAHYQRVCGMRNADGTEMDFSGQGIERLRQEKEAFERSVAARYTILSGSALCTGRCRSAIRPTTRCLPCWRAAACRCCSTAPAARTAQVSGPC